MSFFSDLIFEARALAQSLTESVGTPVVRLGVTGLSRAGKTVFITALIQHLTELGAPGARRQNALPVFRVMAEGRLTRGRLEPQPDDQVPRFAYEDHRAALKGGDAMAPARHWPESTRRISEVRIKPRLRARGGACARARPNSSFSTSSIIRANGCSTCRCSARATRNGRRRRSTPRALRRHGRRLAADVARLHTSAIGRLARAPEEGNARRRGAELFTAYLKSCRADNFALSTLPPGRFLMPGDLEGSPALTFAPLQLWMRRSVLRQRHARRR